MGKREIIERALNQVASERIADTTVIREVFKYPSLRHSSEVMVHLAGEVKDAVFDALAEQAIVIECEVEHRGEEGFPTETLVRGMQGYWLAFMGHRGTPGKAIAIILPLEEE